MPALSEEVANQIKKNFITFRVNSDYFIISKDGSVEKDTGETIKLEEFIRENCVNSQVEQISKFLSSHNIEFSYDFQTGECSLFKFTPVPVGTRTIRLYDDPRLLPEITKPDSDSLSTISVDGARKLLSNELEAARKNLRYFEVVLEQLKQQK